MLDRYTLMGPLLSLFAILSLSWPSPAHATFAEFCRRVGRAAAATLLPGEKITRPPSVVTVVEGGVLSGPAGESRYANGTYLTATDAEGKLHHLFILSDYFMGHGSHGFKLPKGWKVKELIHRGEYEIVDGKIVKGNSTSGKAHAEGAANAAAPASALLEGSGLLARGFRFEPFVKGSEHLYAGFNEPGGTPDGLHSYRNRVDRAFYHVRDFLDAKFYDMLTVADGRREGPTPAPAVFVLRHWDLITASVPQAERPRLAALRAGLEKADKGQEVTAAEAPAMLEGMKLILKSQQAVVVMELPPPERR